MRKLLILPLLLAALVGLAAPASAANGLIGNYDGSKCLTVIAGRTNPGGPVFVGQCNAREAVWTIGSSGLIRSNVADLCIEAPPAGGYVFLERCGRNQYQFFKLVRSTRLIAMGDRALTVDLFGSIQSYPINGGAAQQWSW
jgi:hypothetical protein